MTHIRTKAKELKTALTCILRVPSRRGNPKYNAVRLRTQRNSLVLASTDGYVYLRFRVPLLPPHSADALDLWISADEAKKILDITRDGETVELSADEKTLSVRADGAQLALRVLETQPVPAAREQKLFDHEFKEERCPNGFTVDVLKKIPRLDGTTSRFHLFGTKPALLVDRTESGAPRWEMAVQPLSPVGDLTKKTLFRDLTDTWKD